MNGRGISNKFISDLKEGPLRPVLDAVLCDDTICLEIRDNYINVYYRGGSMLRIEEKPSGYSSAFDIKYCVHKTHAAKYKQQIQSAKSVLEYVEIIPLIKAEMDLYFFEHPKLEREIQQHIMRENNLTSHAKDTDYYIADIEYANMQNGSRFDMLALKWPSTSLSRKNGKGLGLSFIEVKFGDNALMGAAGLKKHFEDMESFLSMHPASEICTEAQKMFNQKVELGIINGLSEATKICIDPGQKTEFILLIANHKPASSVLKRELGIIVKTDIYRRLHEMTDIRIAYSSLVGYGLYEKTMLSLEDYINEN